MLKSIWLLFPLICLTLVVPALAQYPQRIVSGMPSITEMLFALGLNDKVVGVTSNCNFPAESKNKEKVGGFFLNLEKIVSLKPDLVVMLEDAQRREVKKFRDFGLPVFTINPSSVEEVKEALRQLGGVTGTRQRAEELIAQMDQKLRFVREKVEVIEPKEEGISETNLLISDEASVIAEIVEYQVIDINQPKALVIVGLNPLVVVGGGTLINDMIKYAGAKNIAEETRSAYPQYSFENMVKQDPELIIVSDAVANWEQIMKDGRWKSLEAVKRGRILFMNADLLSRPGPRIVEAIAQIADFIY